MPPLSLTTVFFNSSDGASSSLTNSQMIVSPSPMDTDVTSVPGSSSHVIDVFV